MRPAPRTFADLERDSFALLVGWQSEKEERAAAAPQTDRSAAQVLADLPAAIDRAGAAR